MIKIKPNFRSNIPCLRLYLDIETSKPGDEKIATMDFRLACTIYENVDSRTITLREEKRHFWDYVSLGEYVLSKTQDKKKLYIFAHNADFDVWSSGILPILTQAKWVKTFDHINGMQFIMSVKKEKRKIIFISSTNYYPFKLKDLGKMFGLPKLDTDVFTEDDALLLTYCQRDVEILQKIMHSWFDFLKKGKYGGFALTLGSQAFKAFRHRFYDYPIYPHLEEDVKLLERKAYFGGRTENFYKGDFNHGKFAKLDFNSNYAFIMKNNSFPTKLVDVFENITLDHLAGILDTQLAIAEVVLNTSQNLYPIRFNKKIIFPIGEFKTTLCSGSLLYALKHNHIVRINKGSSYEGRFIFKSYINHFFPKRIEAKITKNKALEAQLKLMQNTLYGKFAERHTIYETREEFEGDDCYRRKVYESDRHQNGMETKVLNLVKSVVGYKDSNHTLVAISAHVTDWARLLLWDAFLRLKKGMVYYCDTDSIIIRKKYLYLILPLIHENRLGALKIEEFSDFINILAPKVYTFNEKLTHKGLPKNHTKDKDGVHHYSSIVKSTTLQKRGVVQGAQVEKHIKTFRYDVTKGKINEYGKISPFVLPDDADLLLKLP